MTCTAGDKDVASSESILLDGAEVFAASIPVPMALSDSLAVSNGDCRLRLRFFLFSILLSALDSFAFPHRWPPPLRSDGEHAYSRVQRDFTVHLRAATWYMRVLHPAAAVLQVDETCVLSWILQLVSASSTPVVAMASCAGLRATQERMPRQREAVS